MRVRRSMLPPPGDGLAWSVRQKGDAVELRLREQGVRRRVLATWSTNESSKLQPDPDTALHQVAAQLAGSVTPRPHRHRMTTV